MDYNKIILILAVLLVILLVGGIFVIFNNNASTVNVNDSIANNTSSSIDVEQITTEEASSQSDSNTHLVIAEDGHYYICDDNGKILEKLGPSKKYYPNDPAAVEYPDAESYYPYKQKAL
ncbi:MAG: hypothetical protein IK044_01445 [Methanobrevibacter sp.]|nr:hypothetical protein [Methanobrevibacter sp.]